MVSKNVALKEAKKIRARGKNAKVIKMPSWGKNEYAIETSEKKKKRK